VFHEGILCFAFAIRAAGPSIVLLKIMPFLENIGISLDGAINIGIGIEGDKDGD
jgi:hypothetical protein